MIEITINEVSEMVGVSESQLLKNFKRYIPKLNKYSITFSGKGQKRKFYQVQIKYSDEQIAYETFEQIVYNAWGFDRQTNIDKLLLFIGVSLALQELKTQDSFCTNKAIANRVGLNKNTVSKYKNILTKNNILLPYYLEPYITIVSYKYKEFPSYTSELELKYSCVGEDPYKDIHSYIHTVRLDKEPIIQQQQSNIVANNSIWESYLNSRKDKNIFESNLGIVDIKAINKAKFSDGFMKDNILLEIIFKSFLYKFSYEKGIIELLKKFDDIS